MGRRLSHGMRRDGVLAAVASTAVMTLWLLGWTAALERPLADLLLRLPRPAAGPPPPVAAVVIDEPSLSAHGPLPWPRDRLAELVVRVRESQAAGVVLDVLLADPTGAAADAALADALSGLPHVLAAVLDGHGGWILPMAELGGARYAAHAHAESSGDGILRRVAYTKQAGKLSLPALSVAAARIAGWQGVIVPGGSFSPDFRLRPGRVPRLSAAELLAGTRRDEELRGRVVFLGISAVGAGDQFFSPVGSRRRPSPGVLVHAAVAASLLRNGVLVTANPVAVALLMLATSLAALRWRSTFRRTRFLVALICVVLVPGIALATLWAGNIQLPVLSLWLAVWAAMALGEATEIRHAQHQADQLLRQLITLDSLPAGRTAEHGEVPDRLQLVRGLQTRMARQLELRRSLLEALEEGVVLWDERGEVLLANAACSQLWGHAPAAREVVRWDRAGGAPPMETFQAERGGRALELRCARIAGGTLAVMRDLSQSIELERRRRETQRLVSHELKTPLASISGFGAMLERYELDRDELKRIAAMIRGEADRLGAMVRRFLDLERLNALDLEEEFCTVDLSAVVAERCRILSGADGESTPRLTVTLPDQACTIRGVPSLLAELVDNLVGNALKYSPQELTVTVRVELRAERAVVEVEDHGPGIPEESLPRLFESFYRVPGSDVPGSGLGLAVVKAVADRHDATLHVASEVGSGSVFSVSFARIHEGGALDDTANPGR